ncbi:MAG: hypothetical protein NZ807_04260, partial [Dehalococcoidia bacterium]|nr:hypothetical protein [Dehalococcoidia bacterium]
KARREQAEEELKKLEAQRRATHGLEDVRESLEDICKRVAERFESFDFDEKRLGLEALNVTATVTDVQVEINAVLGVKEPDPRLITTGQTSACSPSGSYSWEWKIEYLLLGVTPTGV